MTAQFGTYFDTGRKLKSLEGFNDRLECLWAIPGEISKTQQ